MRRSDYRAVEAHVSIDIAFPSVVVLTLRKHAADRSEVLGSSPFCGKGCSFGFNSNTPLNHFDDINSTQHSVPVFGDVERSDKHSSTLPGRQHTATCELSDCFANSRAAHSKLRAEGVLSGQLCAQWPLSGSDAIKE